MRTKHTWLGTGLVALGATVAACALLGPLLLGAITYRTSTTSLDQIGTSAS